MSEDTGAAQEGARVIADQTIFPDELSQRFAIGAREVVVKPFVIADYRRAAAALGALATRVSAEHPEVDLSHLDRHLDVVLPTIADSIGMLFSYLFGIDAAYVDEHCTMATALDIIAAALEVNDLPSIRKNLLRARQSLRSRT
ncbi:MAG: hypothetical protein ACE149_06795 [Armatimonadota bacterium]